MSTSFATSLNKVYLGNNFEEIEEQESKRVKVETGSSSPTSTISGPDLLLRRRVPDEGIILIRGFIVYVFNMRDKSWKRLPDCRRDRSYFETCILKGDLYAISTFNVLGAGTVEKFNLETRKWMSVTPLPKRIRSVAASVVGESLLVFGGYDVETKSASNFVYKMTSLPQSTEDQQGGGESDVEYPVRWDTVGRLKKYRYRHACRLFEGKVYIVGGITRDTPLLEEGASDSYVSTTEIYDPVTNRSVCGPDLCTARAIEIALVVAAGTLYVVGGDVAPKVDSEEDGEQDLRGGEDTIERFDKATNSWVFETKFPFARHGFTAAVHGSDIFVFGGACGETESTWDAYNVETKKWWSENPGLKKITSAVDLSNFSSLESKQQEQDLETKDATTGKKRAKMDEISMLSMPMCCHHGSSISYKL